MGINANYMTLNPLYHIGYGYPLSVGSYIKDGNLTMDLSQSNFGIGMTHGFYSGKWYWEILLADKGQFLLGFITTDTFTNQKTQPHNTTGSYLVYTDTSNNGQKVEENSFISLANFNAGDGDIIGVALDRDNRKFWVSLNGTFINSGNPAGGSNPVFDSGDITATTGEFRPIFGTYGGQAVKMTLNAGQDSSFVNQKTSGSANATDDNGFGDFYYTPPTGYLSACSNNVPTSDDIDPAQTDDDYPSKNFNAVAYSGTGSTHNIDVGFKPDLIWTKIRVASDSRIVDSTRGASKSLISNNNNAQETYVNGVTAFTSTGYTLSTDQLYNGSAYTYVAWCWRANGGTTSTNTQGDVTSTVQANQAAGFSIVTFTGTLGESASTASVGHGLTAIPDLILSKSYDTGSKDWTVLHSGLTSRNYKLTLNTTAAEEDRSSAGDMSSLFTTTTYGTNATTGLNQSGRNYVAYVWHSVEGYSKFGKYIGNYDADGQFIYTGFRPKMLFVKRLDAVNSWFVWDTARTTFNKMNSYLYWDLNNAEETGYAIDVVSNGFKLRGQNNATNNNGGEFVYGAWGDVPFKYNNTF